MTKTKTKTAYIYSDVGQFLGTITAFLDQVASNNTQTDIFILPTNSTFTPVPDDVPAFHSAKINEDLESWSIVEDYSQTPLWEKKTAMPASIGFMEPMPQHLTTSQPLDVEAGFANYFNVVTNHWELVPDLRGQTYYKKLSGEPVLINEIGSLSDDLTDKEKPDQLYVWDKKKNNWVIDKVLKQEFITAQNSAKKVELKVAVEERIVLLERKDKLKRATPEDLALLDSLYGYTLDLDELDLTQENLVFPAVP